MNSNARQVMNEAPGWCNVTYSPTGRMIDSWFWEEMREGVDDDSYLHTLEALIEQTAGNEAPAVVEAREAAREVLAGIADHIDLDITPSARRTAVAYSSRLRIITPSSTACPP